MADTTQHKGDVKKSGLYLAAIPLARKEGLIFQPFFEDLEGPVSSLDGAHICCVADLAKSKTFSGVVPNFQIHYGDNVDWFTRPTFAKDTNFKIADFDAPIAPWKCFEKWVKYVELKKACLCFFTWAYTENKYKKKYTKTQAWDRCKVVVAALCSRGGKTAAPIDVRYQKEMVINGRPLNILWSAFSVVDKEGEHLKGSEEIITVDGKQIRSVTAELNQEFYCGPPPPERTCVTCLAQGVKSPRWTVIGENVCYFHSESSIEMKTQAGTISQLNRKEKIQKIKDLFDEEKEIYQQSRLKTKEDHKAHLAAMVSKLLSMGAIGHALGYEKELIKYMMDEPERNENTAPVFVDEAPINNVLPIADLTPDNIDPVDTVKVEDLGLGFNDD